MISAPRSPSARRALPRLRSPRPIASRSRGLANAPARPPARPSAGRAGAAQLMLVYGEASEAARIGAWASAQPVELDDARRAARDASGARGPSCATIDATPAFGRVIDGLERVGGGSGVDDGRWHGLREGAREILLTLAATFAIGFSWAAIEAGRLNAELAQVPEARPAASEYAAPTEMASLR